MKAILIDDEQHVIDAIQILVDWEHYGITERFTASSVSEAIWILDKERPELAFVDVVLGDKLGSEILTHINADHLPTKSIIISGYDSYNYIRAMFLLGGIDYLLKPIEIQALNRAIEKTVTLIRQENEQQNSDFSMDKQFRRLYPDHEHSLMRKLFQEKFFENSYKELCRTNLSFSRAKECTVLFSQGIFLPLHRKEYPMQLSQLINRIQYELEEGKYGTIFQRASPNPDICILLYSNIDHAKELISSFLKDFNNYYSLSLPLVFGSSGKCPFPEGLMQAYQNSVTAFLHSELNPKQYIIPYKNTMHEQTIPINLGIENAIFSTLLPNEKTQLSLNIHVLMDYYSKNTAKNRGGIDSIRQALQALYHRACLYLTAQCGCKVPEDSKLSSDFSSLCESNWQETLLQIENYILLLFMNLQEFSREYTPHRSMKVVADWLEMNYMKKIRQQECADLFHFNKDYMCRKFKEEYGIGMINYLNHIRIEHSKIYLVETDMQYQEIADAVGIFDSKYFAKLFKSETGETPTEYRHRSQKPI